MTKLIYFCDFCHIYIYIACLGSLINVSFCFHGNSHTLRDYIMNLYMFIVYISEFNHKIFKMYINKCEMSLIQT